ncbi:MAG: chorismate mutase [Desulfobacterales bacterium]|jgi:chorismate mutase|nr:chorismate mutase [Desulfobacterales bacterium]MDP6684068.1 chorismate mutase [Desulfobacterales bacterium]MDP6806277.1 chorismate mutase [Desulfobacterales bacterium]|tara:strand:+ start:84612 stop:84914 length:303 start_codon:yes stop_codon:yes gene_type:complete
MKKSDPNNFIDNLNADIRASRSAIDKIDEKILDLINKRFLLVQEIGHIKKRCGIRIVDKGREKEIINRLTDRNKGPLDDDALHHIFTAIIVGGRGVQRTL